MVTISNVIMGMMKQFSIAIKYINLINRIDKLTLL